MADGFKIKFDYTSPANIEASVPGEQKLRENPPENIESDENAASEDIDNLKTNENSKIEDDLNTTTVYTVTKNEVGFTKGDLKLQKVSVTENIAESKAEGSPITHKVINPFYSDVQGEVISEPQLIRENGESKVKQPQTRIPKFRQAVERIKERKSSNKTDKDTLKKAYVEEVPRRNSLKSESNIPRRTITEKKNLTPKNNRKEIDTLLINNKKENVTLIVKDSNDKLNNDLKVNNEDNTFGNNDNNSITVPEDEFDKIYEEIVDNSPTTPLIESILIDKIDDPEKLETSFEEIIHDYEENKIQPIDATKATANRKLSKQNSVQNSVEPKVRDRRYSLSENNDNDDKTQGKTDIKYITKPKTNIPIRPKDKRTLVTENKSKKDLTKDAQNIRNQIKPNRKDLNTQKNSPNKDKINDPKEIVKAAALDNNIKNNAKKENSKENSTQDSTENNSNYHNNEKFNTKVDPEEKNILNRNQSEMPDSSKLVQNMLSNIDPQSLLKDNMSKGMTESTSETTENVDINTDNVPATKIDDDMLKKMEGAPRRRSLKSRIAVLRRRKSMEAKNKVDKGDLYPKNVNNEEDSEPTSDKDVVENKTENKDDKLEQKPSADEQITKPQTPTKETVQTIPNKTKPEHQIDIDNSEFVNNHEDCVTDDTYKENGINTDLEKKTNIQNPVDRNEEIEFPEIYETNIKAKEEVEEEESIPILKGKVNRIIGRLDSRQESIKPTVDIKNEIPVKKSVSSRIAMFERQVSKEPDIPAIVTKKTESKYKPRIISEVLKPNIQKEINPNEIRVENKKRESVIVDEDTANNYIEISFVNSPESNITDQTTDIKINKDSSKDNDQLLQSGNIINNVNNKESNDKFKPYITMTKELTNEISKTKSHGITDLNKINQYTSHEQKNKVCNTQSDSLIKQTDTDNNKNPNLINSNQKSKETSEELNKSAATKPKSTITSSKSETHLTKYKRDERSNAEDKFKRMISGTDLDAKKERSKSVAELDIGNAVKGKVHQMVVRMNSRENLLEVEKKQAISARERPREKSVLEKIALFERKLTPVSPENMERTTTGRKVALTSRMTSVFTEKPVTSPANSLGEKPSKPITNSSTNKPEAITLHKNNNYTEEEYLAKLSDLVNACTKYGRVDKMAYLKLSNGQEMPVLSLGTALLNDRLLKHVIGAAIDMGYRALDCAYIYGNEAAVGEVIKAKIDNGTVTREELFITNKLWSTFHRRDLVEQACRASLKAMNLEYFDLYLIHNPMSFKEGGDPIPKIANVLQYSDVDYLDAWYGMEGLVAKGLVKSIGVSNFNASQVTRVAEKARVKPVINQVECHPYLTQLDLENVCKNLGIKLNCFGVLGSKGTPAELKNNQTPVIEDPLVKVMAAGLNVSPAQLLIRYQLEHGRAVVVKASSASHLWENLGALNYTLSAPETDALDALNQNKRTYSYKGMGDTHKNYPFKPSY